MPGQPTSIADELEGIVHEIRHLHNEHQREGPGDRRRRRLGQRLGALEERFGHLLEHWLPDPHERRLWWDYLHQGSAEPPPAPDSSAPLLFAGVADGSRMEIRTGSDGASEIEVDGALIRRLGDLTALGDIVELGNRRYQEVFELPEAALVDLERFVEDPSDGPPFRWSVDLVRSGLTDPHFGLTDRGRRLIARRRGERPLTLTPL